MERAPSHVDEQPAGSDEWMGLSRLVEVVHECYFDSNTLLPTPCDWTREDEVTLRCAMLLALSFIKATNRLSPRPAVNTLLLFCESHVNRPVAYTNPQLSEEEGESATDDKVRTGRAEASADSTHRPHMVVYDDSHYVASLLLSLRGLRIDQHSKRDPQDPLRRIADFALTRLRTDVSMAKAQARVLHSQDAENGGDYIYPVLPLCGAVSAAALACLGDMDVQYISIVDKERKQSLSVAGSKDLKINNALYIATSGEGGLSGLFYPDFFLPVGKKLTFTPHSDAPTDTPSGLAKWDRDFEMYPWSVRLAALEAFIRLCLAQGLLYAEKVKRLRQQQIKQEQVGGKPAPAATSIASPLFASAILEVVLYLVAHDPDRRTRRGAALCLLECLQGRPSGRPAQAALACGDAFSCLGHSDPEALTRADFETLAARPAGGGGRGGETLKLLFQADCAIMLRSLWHTVCLSPGDEVSIAFVNIHMLYIHVLWMYM